METIFNINRNAFDALFMKILTGLWDCRRNKTGRVFIIRVRVGGDYFLRFHDLNKPVFFAFSLNHLTTSWSRPRIKEAAYFKQYEHSSQRLCQHGDKILNTLSRFILLKTKLLCRPLSRRIEGTSVVV